MSAGSKQLVFTTPKEKDFEAVIDFLGLISIEPSSKQRSWLGRQKIGRDIYPEKEQKNRSSIFLERKELYLPITSELGTKMFEIQMKPTLKKKNSVVLQIFLRFQNL
ncbi:hypothetical protein CEXT_517371 [Caerostris extrusa]|uniref:Uncharacterized protein n=1 Tax=Caerostris extrusa TaxID=172846 RepID=A0AAV4VD76_CAEEX|nr:hypothetical protein CEXT_517371 [Caerostris extrusa]